MIKIFTIAAACVILSACGYPTENVDLKPRDGCDQRVVLATVYSLEQHPGRWSSDGFRLESSDVYIWVANEDYGLEIMPDDTFSNFDIGSSGFEEFTPECRALLYDATQEWTAGKVVRKLGIK